MKKDIKKGGNEINGVIINGHMRKIEIRIDRLDARLSKLEAKTDILTAKVARLEVKINQLEVKVDKLEVKVNQLEVKVDKIDAKIDWVEKSLRTEMRLMEGRIKREIVEQMHGDKMDILGAVADFAKRTADVELVENLISGRVSDHEDRLVKVEKIVLPASS